jgi:DNA-binding NtrC family response regulator
MSDSVLLVDDDPGVLRAVGEYLRRVEYAVFEAATGQEGIETYERHRPEVVILDLRLPGMSGLDVLERLREMDAAVVLLTGHGDIETAVRAMQLGAENFLTKPVDMQHLVAAVARVADKVHLRREVDHLKTRVTGEPDLQSLGVSPVMNELARQIRLIASSERTTVLLTGESGTGKGWVARMIHGLSGRAHGPFVDVNCAGLTSTFLDSELFGHEKGAFTDAKEMKRGLFEVADRGLLFLDEVGDLSPDLQPKLLKVLETKCFRRLGGTREIAVDVRLVAATNQHLEERVANGAFREDLYYRLGVAVLHLPPVRDRPTDDRLHVLKRLLAGLVQDVPGAPTDIASEAVERLLRYDWPGNIREMRNVLERTMIMARDAPTIRIEHLPADVRRGAGRGRRRHQPVTLAESERQQIERALRYHGGNRTHAAKELGISRATLIKKIKLYELDL